LEVGVWVLSKSRSTVLPQTRPSRSFGAAKRLPQNLFFIILPDIILPDIILPYLPV
jgi:hypothetical protein